ncbi:uncharacterized protein LY89DRAFT_691686 [Mollisia scopiformis]|uniref:DUF2235 domain-containing protein n=1 Tax=Mollisia scopiformis TaxID=149040 RepID=A0A132B6V6_MOLSC|nr:uncharacterized protein LY89DRAFT_691686 [Mollisia scopiformis]KUJ07614.1 hypothetical protein LY89DRAFT_691686 [Mollisia scopiformis]
MAAKDTLPYITTHREESQGSAKVDIESEAEGRVPTGEFSDVTLEGKSEDVCADCEKAHLPQRLVICHDGTWMLPDGAIGSMKGNASNVFRIWCMVKEGIVTDMNGKQWKQVRAPFIDGIGAVDRIIERIVTGATGEGPTGYEVKIRQIYKMCCDICPSRDEIFMFGYSRGAFILRSVAGLLHHLQALKPSLPDFDEQFLRGLRIYRAAQTKSQFLENSVFRHLSQNTRPAPKIKFLGCFDTIKAVNDSNLNDIGLLDSTLHVRHAMALFEKRDQLLVERFDVPKSEVSNKNDHSFQEAWFAGSHGNLGGAGEEDGLALWPLQWIVSEAEKQGLVLGFNRMPKSELEDPAKLIFPKGTHGMKQIDCANGINICIWNLAPVLDTEGFFPLLDSGRSSVFITTISDRAIFSTGGANSGKLIGYNPTARSGTFIHPSVFLLDETVASIANTVNATPYCEALRSQAVFSVPNSEQNFWNIHKELAAKKEIQYPRIVVCGMTEVGKSTLINAALGKKMTQESKGHQPGEHDIQVALESEDKSFIIHDSCGFEAGKESNYTAVQDFLIERRDQPSFQEQVHCIWYCVSTDNRRIQGSDRKFKEIDFGGVPVLLVFTKSDRLKREMKSLAIEEYQIQHECDVEDISDIPNSDKAHVKEREKELYEEEMLRRSSEWFEEIGVFSDYVFVSGKSRDPESVNHLLDVSRESMSSDRMIQIHAHAQDVFVDRKLKTSITKLVSMLLETRPKVAFFNSNERIEKLVTSAIQTTASIFHYKNFNPDAYVLLIRTELWPPTPPESVASWIPGGIAGGVATGAVYGAMSLLLGPVGVFARAAVWVGGIAVAGVANAQKLGLGLIMACLDVLLVLERLFWYTGSQIDEKCVHAACLYYLRVRPKVFAKVMGRLGTNFLQAENWPNKLELECLLTDIVKEFRYKRRSSGSSTVDSKEKSEIKGDLKDTSKVESS